HGYWASLRIEPDLISQIKEAQKEDSEIWTIVENLNKQFWSTARIETTEEGTKILATVDGILKTVTESSLRRNLKLKDEEGISSLPDAELFENPTLMGYNISPNQKFTFQKGFNEFSSNIATALVCLANNRTYNFSKMIFDGMIKNVNNEGEGSGTPTEPYHTPSPEAQQTSYTTHSSPTLPPVTTAPIPTVTSSDTPIFRQYTRRARIAQSSALPPVADEHASPLRDVSEGEACPTDSGFGADQDRANIAKTSTLPYDSAPRVTSPAADEGSMQLKLDELMGLCTSLQRKHSEMVAKFEAQELEINRLKARVKLLEDREGVAAERSGDDAPIKGRNLDEGSGSIPTAGPPAAEVPTGSDVVPTAGLIFVTATVVTPYTRRKGKETMVESETLKKKKIQKQMDIQMARQIEEEMERDAQRMNEQIARDAEIARIHAEEELKIMIDGLDRSNETIAKYLQEYHKFATELPLERRIELISDLVRYQDNYAKVQKFQTQQRKPWSKKQKRDYYMAVIKSNLGWKVKDFRGMTCKEIKAKFTTVWKQIKNFIPIGSKEEVERLKRKGLCLEQESVKKLKTSESVPEEVKSPDEVPEEKALVKESLSNRPPTSDKEIELWVELKRLYEPDDEDQLWTHTQNLMYAPVEWKLYDTCGVHHVTSKDREIFMLVKKDYPLRKGLAIVMICYKFQVDNYSQMANDLILKIYKIANCPRRIVGNKMHKAFPLPVIEFPLPEEVLTASEESSHCQKKREATAVKIALLLKSRKNCQSKSDDSYTKFLKRRVKIVPYGRNVSRWSIKKYILLMMK
nr:hypothetical protein [Tanacetum cinerariifolium]